MTPKTIKPFSIGFFVVVLTAHALRLLLTRKPVLAELVSGSLHNRMRYSPRQMRIARIGDALSLADEEPTETVNLCLRY